MGKKVKNMCLMSVVFVGIILFILEGQSLALLAANTRSSGIENLEEAPASPQLTVLQVDTKNRYSGMERSYEDGYMPNVSATEVNLVLPLLAESGKIKNNRIHVTFDLGDPSSSPFVFQNFNKSISLSPHKIEGSEQTSSAYYVQANLRLLEKRNIGRYPVTVNVQWQEETGEMNAVAFTIYVTIVDGIDPDITPTPIPEPTPEPEEKPKPAPKVMISRTVLDKESVKAGDTVQVSVTFLNTNENQDIGNIKITATSGSTDLVIKGDTNSYYIEKLEAKKETTISFSCEADMRAKAERKEISFSIAYEGFEATAFTEEESILIAVYQPLRLEYDEIKFPGTVNVGETISVPINMMNMGLSTIHNVKISIEAPGFIPDSSLFLGNLESGASKQQDAYIFVTKKTLTTDNASSDGQEYGFTEGVVLITYEDELGQTYEDVVDFSTSIEEMVIETSDEPEVDEKEQEQQTQWLVSVVVGGILIAAAAVFLILRNRKNKKYEDFGTNEDQGMNL